MSQLKKLKYYYYTAVASVVIAVAAFTYNTWRLEVTESNSNIRTASFRVLTELAELEQLIYIAHYDKNTVDGSPRIGWVKIGLINDLSGLISDDAKTQSVTLKIYWAKNWDKISDDRDSVDQLVAYIEGSRKAIKQTLLTLN